MAEIHVLVTAVVGDNQAVVENRDEAIPPDYDDEDTRALARRMIEDTAFALNDRAFGRAPALRALIAAAARLRGLTNRIEQMPANGDRAALIAILDLTNDEVTALFPEFPDSD
jgi:hypothetical protein